MFIMSTYLDRHSSQSTVIIFTRLHLLDGGGGVGVRELVVAER